MSDIFGDLFGQNPTRRTAPSTTSKGTGEVAPQVRAREIDGNWYLRAEDVLTTLNHYGHEDSPLAAKLRKIIGGAA